MNSTHIFLNFVVLSTTLAVSGLGFGQERIATRAEALQALRRARVSAQVGEAAEAKKLVQSALDFAKQANDKLVLAWGQHAGGELAFAAGDGDAALVAFTISLDAFTGLSDSSGMAASRTNLGRLLAASRPREALVHQQAALEIYKKLNRPAELAAAYGELAATQRALGALDEAEAAWESALALYRKDASGQPAAELAALSSLGSLKAEQGEQQEATALLAAAVKLAVAQKDPASEAGVRNSLAIAHQRQGAFDDALREYQAALKLRTSQAPDPAAEAEIRNNLGALLLDRGDTPAAVAELNKALALSTGLKDQGGIARAHYNLAVAAESLGKTAEAAASYEKALAIRRTLKDNPGTVRILDNLAVLYASQGDAQKAKAHRDEAERLRMP
jgi:tetratricopeptide (TPR) repeat protein